MTFFDTCIYHTPYSLPHSSKAKVYGVHIPGNQKLFLKVGGDALCQGYQCLLYAAMQDDVLEGASRLRTTSHGIEAKNVSQTIPAGKTLSYGVLLVPEMHAYLQKP